MHAISNRHFDDLQAVLAYVSTLKGATDVKEANTIRKARLLLRAFSNNKPKK